MFLFRKKKSEVFKRRAQIVQETRRRRAVERAVIERERQPHRGIYASVVAETVHRRAYAEDRNLRRIDNGREAFDSERTEIRYGERAPPDISSGVSAPSRAFAAAAFAAAESSASVILSAPNSVGTRSPRSVSTA